MRDTLAWARNNGYGQLLQRVGIGGYRRGRDRVTAHFLGSPGFRAGALPRLLGLRHMEIAPDFHAGDGLWLEAVLHYGEGAAKQLFSPELRIGRSARLSDHVHIACLRQITMGDHLLCGSRVLISDHAHGRYDESSTNDPAANDLAANDPAANDPAANDPAANDPAARNPAASDPAIPPASRPLYSAAPVRIGDNVWLGDGVAVLAGADIGDGCVIGANSVVTGPIPPRTVAVGAPARVVRRWDAVTGTWPRVRR